MEAPCYLAAQAADPCTRERARLDERQRGMGERICRALQAPGRLETAEISLVRGDCFDAVKPNGLVLQAIASRQLARDDTVRVAGQTECKAPQTAPPCRRHGAEQEP